MNEPTARLRFIGELEPARRVAALYTAQVLNAGVAGDRPYVVSAYVDGPSLRRLVIDEGPRGRHVLERLAMGTAIALTAIHRSGVVHRNLKPANVLLSPDGPYVTDFGLARALDSTTTATGVDASNGAYSLQFRRSAANHPCSPAHQMSVATRSAGSTIVCSFVATAAP